MGLLWEAEFPSIKGQHIYSNCPFRDQLWVIVSMQIFLDDGVFFILATIYYTISQKHVPVCTPQRSSATSSDSTGLNFLHPVTTSMRLPHPVYLSPCSYHLSVFKRRAQMLLIDFMKLPLFRNQINLSPIDGKPTLTTGKELPPFICNNKYQKCKLKTNYRENKN